MLPPKDNFKDSLSMVQRDLTNALKINTPASVAEDLKESGWPWEWACAAVEIIEYRYNPARLSPDARRSQEIHDKLRSHAALGAGLFIVGLVVSIGTLSIALSSGGLIVIAYGAVFVGAGIWLKAYPQLKQYPDRPIPKYVPPRDARDHDPVNY